MKAAKKRRSTSWTFLIWPDSAPQNWIEIIESLHVSWVCSPLHEFDVNEDGTQKKSHYHILIVFDSLKSYEQVLDITEKLNTTRPELVQSQKGLIQYFIHKNNPEKYQYKVEDIKAYGGYDLSDIFKPTSSELERKCQSLDQFIIDNEITEFDYLVQVARQVDEDWIYILRNRNTAFYKTWLQNRSHIRRQNNEKSN